MRVLAGLEPESVFHYFEDICGIPHGSGDTAKISRYLTDFAKEQNLSCLQDDMGNVIIKKAATKGREDHPPVILQGHMDMVCEKTDDREIDFTREGLELVLEEGTIRARGTTLGGDDGIAVAYMLAILASQDISHPPIEAVFTVDEEIGLLGAAGLDCSSLSGKTMLNIDSEEEGHLLVSCAGGVTARGEIPIHPVEKPVEKNGAKGLYRIAVSGLQGGHSGVEIDKGRGNAIVILGRVLQEIGRYRSFDLVSLQGGSKDNAIPRGAEAILLVDEDGYRAEDGIVSDHESRSGSGEKNDMIRKVEDIAGDFGRVLSEEYRQTDSDISLVCEEMTPGETVVSCLDADQTGLILSVLRNLPNGIQRMSFDIEGLVQTSLNQGIMRTEEDRITFTSSVRSSVNSEKREMLSRMEALAGLAGGRLVLSGDYPAWSYREDSPLRDLMIAVYEDRYGTRPQVEAMHAGVECGLFADKIPGLDCVSFGPDLKDIHTPQESMDVASVERTWKYLLEILARL